jgi:hypothetical protein
MKKTSGAPRRAARPTPKKPAAKAGGAPTKPRRAAPVATGARTRKATNLTLSEQAKAMGRILAEARGMNFSQLVEQLVRDEMRRNPRDV